MKISIVIPAYNEEKYIGRTLESVKQLEINGVELEILVIDGGSTDKTAGVARNLGARVITISHGSIGFARQQGILQARGDIIAFTDADTVSPSDWLKKHIAALSENSAVCSYGTYRVDSGTFPYYQITNYLQPLIVSLAFRFGIFLAGGQNIACRRKEALSIGGFDKTLELLEDADFVKRMSKVGKVRCLTDCIVLSSGRRSKEGWRYFIRAGIADFRFFILGKRDFLKFPDYR